MATPDLRFNNGSGSDTAASGAGPTTALTGVAASFATTTVTLDGAPDLSGVATDGSHVLWLKTSTGRQWFTITAVDNTAKTVTVSDAPSGTATGRTWAIGGKRKTVSNADSATLFAASTGAKGGWIITLEDDQPTLTASLTCGATGDANGNIMLRGDSSTTPRLLNCSTNNVSVITLSGGWTFENLKFTSSAATRTTSHGLNVVAGSTTNLLIVRRCVFGDATNKLQNGINRDSGNQTSRIIDCEFASCLGAGFAGSHGATSAADLLFGCYIHDCTGAGIQVPYYVGSSTEALFAAIGCIVVRNGAQGIYVTVDSTYKGPCLLIGNTVHGNTGDGIYLKYAENIIGAVIANNQITSNGGYGLNCAAGTAAVNDKLVAFIAYNNFWNNSSGARTGISAGSRDTAVDPGYTNAARSDFSVSGSARAIGFPASSAVIGLNSLTRTFVDAGAAQRRERPITARTRPLRSAS